MNPSHIREAERILGYSFDKPELLEEALTHSSFSNDGAISYERLEVVGDAALDLAMTNYLYLSDLDLGPDRITLFRSANVSNERLARVAVWHGIYPLVRRNSPGLDKQVEKFTKAVMQEPEMNQIYGGGTKKAPKVLADVIEAIAAAIYEDCDFNLDVMWKVVRRLLEPLITPHTFSEQPVTTLNELFQKIHKDVKYHPSQNGNTTIVYVIVDSEVVGEGSAEQQDIAKLNAARDALEKLSGEKSYLLKPQHKKVGDEEKAKEKLNEFHKKRNWPPPVYILEEEKGPAHRKTFMCSVHVEATDNFIVLGEYRSRVKDAEKSAARDALEKLSGEESYRLKSQHKKVGDEEKAKEKLSEFCRKKHWPRPAYILEEENGPAHRKTFICSVHIETRDNFIAWGEYRSRIKDAEKSAALKMLPLVRKLYA